MPAPIRKFIAILMLLWLPIFTGNALAASLAMQMAQGECHEASAPMLDDSDMSAMDMREMDMGEHHHADASAPIANAEQDSTCSGCAVCHLACTGYLSVPSIALLTPIVTPTEKTPYLAAFSSVSSAPLDPPPLARA